MAETVVFLPCWVVSLTAFHNVRFIENARTNSCTYPAYHLTTTMNGIHRNRELHPAYPGASKKVFPEVFNTKEYPINIAKSGYSSLSLASGALSLSCESYEPESTRAVHDWFYEEGKEYFAVGVGTTGDWKIGGKGTGFIEDEEERLYLSKVMKSTGGDMLKSVSVNPLASSISHPTSSNDMKVRRLLDLALEQHGRHSLIYVCRILSNSTKGFFLMCF